MAEAGARVEKGLGCPYCGEFEMDRLIFLDDGDKYVHCSTCGTLYEVGVPTPKLNPAAMPHLLVAAKFALEFFTINDDEFNNTRRDALEKGIAAALNFKGGHLGALSVRLRKRVNECTCFDRTDQLCTDCKADLAALGRAKLPA